MTLTEAIARFLSGMINVVLFLILGLTFLKPSMKWTIKVLKCVAPLLLPSCWVVFVSEPMTPLAGYYVWTLGILILVFGNTQPKSFHEKAG